MSRNSLLDFYREIVNSEKSFGIDYKNLSKQLIERIDKAIEILNKLNIKLKDILQIGIDIKEISVIKQILGDKENDKN